MRLISRAMLILCVVHVSCNDANTVSNKVEDSGAKRNIQAWHTVSMAFSTGNVDLLDTVLADDYIDHTPMGDLKGRDSIKAMVVRMRTNFKDVKMNILKELADEEYGFFWMQFTGKRMDPASKQLVPFDMTTVQVVKFKAGKAVEHWEYVERKPSSK